jgi:hypothetical protein
MQAHPTRRQAICGSAAQPPPSVLVRLDGYLEAEVGIEPASTALQAAA